MTTATMTREEKVDLYVGLEAIETIGVRIAGFAEKRRVFDIGSNPDELLVADGAVSCSDLLCELWPNDEDLECDEYREADGRINQIVANVFGLLAGPFGQEFIVDQAMEFSARAAKSRAEANRAAA